MSSITPGARPSFAWRAAGAAGAGCAAGGGFCGCCASVGAMAHSSDKPASRAANETAKRRMKELICTSRGRPARSQWLLRLIDPGVDHIAAPVLRPGVVVVTHCLGLLRTEAD